MKLKMRPILFYIVFLHLYYITKIIHNCWPNAEYFSKFKAVIKNEVVQNHFNRLIRSKLLILVILEYEIYWTFWSFLIKITCSFNSQAPDQKSNPQALDQPCTVQWRRCQRVSKMPPTFSQILKTKFLSLLCNSWFDHKYESSL